MTPDEYLQSAEMLRFSEEEWPAAIRIDLQNCQLPSRQQIKAIEAHWRSGDLTDMFLYVNKQKEKAAKPENHKTAELPFWETFLKWFSSDYARGGLQAELDQRLKDAGLWSEDKKQNRELRRKCTNYLVAGFIQTWCAECNYLLKKQNRGFRSDEERD